MNEEVTTIYVNEQVNCCWFLPHLFSQFTIRFFFKLYKKGRYNQSVYSTVFVSNKSNSTHHVRTE